MNRNGRYTVFLRYLPCWIFKALPSPDSAPYTLYTDVPSIVPAIQEVFPEKASHLVLKSHYFQKYILNAQSPQIILRKMIKYIYQFLLRHFETFFTINQVQHIFNRSISRKRSAISSTSSAFLNFDNFRSPRFPPLPSATLYYTRLFFT